MSRLFFVVPAIACVVTACSIPGAVSLDKYNALTVGMHITEVNEIMGSGGKPVSDFGEYKTLAWGTAGKSIVCTFRVGVLESKFQIGL